MKAQISLHIYKGSVPCRPHIKRSVLLPRGEQEIDEKGRMAHWETESDREEIMKSGKEIKSERNQGEKNERSTGQREDLERKGNGIMR